MITHGAQDSGLWRRLRQVGRFVRTYGLRKTLFKVQGRMRPRIVLPRPARAKVRDVGVIGCGQFAFATIGHHVVRNVGNRFTACYDISPGAAASFADFYRTGVPASTPEDVISHPGVRVVYVASNHASHAGFAQKVIEAGKAVYVEKPVAVDLAQLRSLSRAVASSDGAIFAGYNRPFAAAVRDLRSVVSPDQALSLSCFVHGHVLGPDHWYRRPAEGTRVCGNMGHWIDLAVHMLSWGSMPSKWEIGVAYASASEPDDNLCVSMTSDRGDLISITLTSRTEPFEGIYEGIDLQWGDVIGRIDDFRTLTIRQGSRLERRRYRPKDVGHDRAIMQPFGGPARDWQEVVQSTRLMLAIRDMVVQGQRTGEFDFSESGPPV